MLKFVRRVAAPSVLAIGLLGATSVLSAGATSPARVDPSQPATVIYPADAQTIGEQGNVVINVHVTSAGKPSNVEIARSSGYRDLDTAALQTVLNWHYLPAVRDGDAVSDWTQVNVVYKLSN